MPFFSKRSQSIFLILACKPFVRFSKHCLFAVKFATAFILTVLLYLLQLSHNTDSNLKLKPDDVLLRL